MTFDDWLREQHKIHRKAAHDAGVTPLRAFHNGYVASMLVQLGDGTASKLVADFIIAGGSVGARGLAGFRAGFAEGNGVRSFIELMDERTTRAWEADSEVAEPAGV